MNLIFKIDENNNLAMKQEDLENVAVKIIKRFLHLLNLNFLLKNN